jgi:hypothetical protein
MYKHICLLFNTFVVLRFKIFDRSLCMLIRVYVIYIFRVISSNMNPNLNKNVIVYSILDMGIKVTR